MLYLDIIVNKVLKMYFNLNSNVNLNKRFMRRRTKERHRSANKIFLSKADIKHSNDKIIITLYTYNKTKKFFAKKLSRLYRRIFTYIFVSKKKMNKLFSNNLFKPNISSEFFFLKKKYKKKLMHKSYNKLFVYKYFYNLYKNMLLNKTSDYLVYSKFKTISKKGSVLFKKFIIQSNYIFNILKRNNLYHIISLNKSNKIFNIFKSKYSNLSNKDRLYNNFIKKNLRKEMLYLKYNQLFMTDSYKFSNIYLFRLGNLLTKIYNKKIEFNIINLKYIHLDSHIFTEVLSLKIRDRKNKLMTILKKGLTLQKINNSKKYKYKVKKAYLNEYNSFKNYNTSFIKEDALHFLLKRIFKISLENINNGNMNYLEKEKYIYRSIRFRKIRGVRLEAKGRLTKRLTAAKSIFKIRYRGSLKNIDTINNFPCVLLRGHLNSNIDYVNLNSKTRNGSFGLKG
jgi:hypothetical protein